MARASPSRQGHEATPKRDFQYTASFGSHEPFSTPHTVTVLLVLAALIAYAAFSSGFVPGVQTAASHGALGFSRTIENGELVSVTITAASIKNIINGIWAAIAIGLIFSAEHLRDTLFIRPHPAVWRFVTGVGLLYTMFFAWLLFQNVEDIRQLMPFLDRKVTGQALGARSYGDECALTYANVMSAVMDEFTIAHTVGWIFKHMMLRDIKLSLLLSFLFEFMEYTFEFIQPNFAECWWDHWILDFAVCNMAGIIIGELLMVKLNSKGYDWAGFSEITGVKGKLQRAVLQFTPASWTPYKWHLLHDFRRFCYVLAVVVGAMVIELDAFFLKDLFWVQPTSKLNVYRLIVWWAVAMVGLRDYYAFMSDRSLKRLGSTAWVMLAMMLIEALTVIKFGRHLYKDKPLPASIAWAWGAVLTSFAAWTVWWFFLRAKTPEELAAPSPTAASTPAHVSSAAIVGHAPVPALENAAASESAAAPSASGAAVPASAPRQISRGGSSSVPSTPAQAAPASAPASAPPSAAKQAAPTPAVQAPVAAPAAAIEEEAIELSSDSSDSVDSSSSESESEEEARPRRGAAGRRQASVSAASRRRTPAKAKPTPAKGKVTGGRKAAAAADSEESSSSPSSSSSSESESESSEEEVLPKPRVRGRGARAGSASAATADTGAGSAATRGRRRGGR